LCRHREKHAAFQQRGKGTRRFLCSLSALRHREAITLHFSSAKKGNDDSYSLPATPSLRGDYAAFQQHKEGE
jgi:hypothetical protein